MKKRIFMLLLAVCLMATLLPVSVFAEESVLDAKTGTCGEGISWTLQDGTLTVSGSGEMEDGAPWADYENQIEKLVLTGGITRIGAEAFYDYDRLEEIDFGDSLVEIGERAFYGCDDLTVIHLPATFRKFGAECFRACNSLQRVYCDGGMPRFEKSCLWTDNYISVFYPTNYVWPQEPVSQLISNFGGRLGITMGNYSDADLSELSEPGAAVEETKPAETKAPTEPEETEEPTEAATEAAAVVTEPVVTEPAIVLVIPTEAVTEPVETTEAITEPETQAPTEPETEATEPVLKEAVETLEGKSWIGLVMIGGVLTFLISGAMIFRSVSKKGGKYRR